MKKKVKKKLVKNKPISEKERVRRHFSKYLKKLKAQDPNLEEVIKKVKDEVEKLRVDEKYKRNISMWLDGLVAESIDNDIFIWKVGYDKLSTHIFAIFYFYNKQLKKIVFRTCEWDLYNKHYEAAGGGLDDKEKEELLKHEGLSTNK